MGRIKAWSAAVLLVAASVAGVASAQTVNAAKEIVPGAPPMEGIRQYIDGAWGTLSRSMEECASVRDVKVTTAPVLYLPAEVPEPAKVAALVAGCGVEVLRLPRAVTRLGQVRPEELARPGLLYLPNRYVVPGGRFNEMYGWDSYFIVLGLTADGRTELARGMVENFFYEIEHYGALLNANRTYFLTRSQPPLLAEMIREVHARDRAAEAGNPDRVKASRAWLEMAYTAAERDYALWLTPAHRAGTTGLARYFDVGEGPVLEMADDSSYYPDAIRWMLAHRAEGGQYLVAAAKGDTASCDQRLTAVCRHAEVDGMRLTRDFYQGDRAMRESGFDTSFRFGAFSGSTHHFAPVCLNSLLYRYELDMAGFATELGKTADAARWRARAKARRAAINRYLWDEARGLFVDYDYVARRQSGYLYSTVFYPLWAGVATAGQASRIKEVLPRLEMAHGLAMSSERTGMQWDRPYGWAPEFWFAVEGLRGFGFSADGDRLAGKFRGVVEANYARDGTIREKYDVEDGSAEVRLAAGYRANGVGFGWTNGVYLRLLPTDGSANATSDSPNAASAFPERDF